MYKHILLPVDGSELSREAAAAGIRMAGEGGGRVTALHVIPTVRPDLLEAWAHDDPHYDRRRRSLYSRFADAYLAPVAQVAADLGVPCTVMKGEGSANRVIVAKARELHCELIFMASHGWGGGDFEMLGSETLRVLLHSQVPVLVYKPAPRMGGA
ncbi:MAG TPA: universal stress protein [Telluria sp.]|nr:universal stress protein [Telluria sp.]